MTEETPYPKRSKTPRKILDVSSGTPSSIYVSVQQQKQEQAKKEMAKQLERILDRREFAKEGMLRIREGLEKNVVNIHWFKLQLETLRQCNEELQRTFIEICDLVPRNQRDEHRENHFRSEELHNELFVYIQTEIAKLNAAEEEKQRSSMNVLAPAFVPQQPVVMNNSMPHLPVPGREKPIQNDSAVTNCHCEPRSQTLE